ncbi:MAG TPA: NACHT domain-containing protein, partial [Myxococcaceae bacterium]|nr:NACHT domain-containing protein [Myxococcaceae bacterium]
MTLFIKGDAQHPAAVSAFAAAKMLLERIIVDLDQKARIAVHAAIVSWNPETGKLAHPAIELCGRLAHAAPVNGVAVIEDVYLELPEVKRRQLAALGLTAQDGVPAYVFPASLAARKDPRAFQPGDDLRLWETFRRYVNSPEIRRLRYVGFPLQKKQPPSLDIEEVFVPPEAEPWRWSLIAYLQRYDPEFLDVLVRNGQLELSTRPESIAETVKTRRSLVLLGDPGTGKTTVLRWLAVAAAGGPLAFERRVGSAERLLPLMVSVGRLSEIRTALKTGASVVDAIARYFHDRNVGDEDALRGFLQRRLDAGECLVLLDGLDEVRSDAREGIHRWLETFCAQYSRNRFVVSARQVGYAGFILPESHEVVLGPFNDEQVRRYTYAFERACRRWENNGIADDEAAKREADTLLAALFASPRLRDLARNPFLLSALVLIHRAEGALPRHRVQAYEVFSRTLCETWSSARRVVAGEERSRDIRYEEEAIPILGELALRMHEQWPSGVAPEEFVIETLSAAIRLREEGGAAE